MTAETGQQQEVFALRRDGSPATEGVVREAPLLTSYTVEAMPPDHDLSPDAYRDRLDPFVVGWRRKETPIREAGSAGETITSFRRVITSDELETFDDFRETAGAAGYREAHSRLVTLDDGFIGAQIAFRHPVARPIPDGQYTEQRRAAHGRVGGTVSRQSQPRL